MDISGDWTRNPSDALWLEGDRISETAKGFNVCVEDKLFETIRALAEHAETSLRGTTEVVIVDYGFETQIQLRLLLECFSPHCRTEVYYLVTGLDTLKERIFGRGRDDVEGEWTRSQEILAVQEDHISEGGLGIRIDTDGKSIAEIVDRIVALRKRRSQDH
jgi:hypothetical protein